MCVDETTSQKCINQNQNLFKTLKTSSPRTTTSNNVVKVLERCEMKEKLPRVITE